MSELTELEALRKENDRLKKEGSELRAQLFFLGEMVREIDKRLTARRAPQNGIGQFFCPSCHAIVFEPSNIPHYWRRCQYANKEPPDFCPKCGQRLECIPGDVPAFEEDPLKNQHKGEKKNGTWNYRR